MSFTVKHMCGTGQISQTTCKFFRIQNGIITKGILIHRIHFLHGHHTITDGIIIIMILFETTMILFGLMGTILSFGVIITTGTIFIFIVLLLLTTSSGRIYIHTAAIYSTRVIVITFWYRFR